MDLRFAVLSGVVVSTRPLRVRSEDRLFTVEKAPTKELRVGERILVRGQIEPDARGLRLVFEKFESCS